MRDQPFEVGDMVMVKSGSPLMTVEAILEGGVVTVVYYLDGVRKNEDHPAAVLERYKPNPVTGWSDGGSADPDDWGR